MHSANYKVGLMQKIKKIRIFSLLATLLILAQLLVPINFGLPALADHNQYHFSSVPDNLPRVPLDYVGVSYNTNDPSSPYYDEPFVNIQWRNYSNYFIDYSREYTTWTIKRNGSVLASWSGENKLGDGCPYGGCDRYNDMSVQRGNEYTYTISVTMSKDGKTASSPPSVAKTVYVANDDPPEVRLSVSVDGTQYRTNAPSVSPNTDVTLSWQRVRGGPMNRCEASGDWSGNKSAGGSETVNVGSAIGKRVYRITCYNTAENLQGGSGTSVDVVNGASSSSGEYTYNPPISFDSNTSFDMNGDGTADGTQDNVLSVYNSTTSSYSVIESDNSCGVDLSSGVLSPSGFTNESDEFEYPFGVMSFRLNCEESGSSSNVKQIYFTNDAENLSQLSLRKYNTATGEFSTINGGSITTSMVNGQRALVVTYAVQDGGDLDEDGEANGVIVDPIAIARPANPSGAAAEDYDIQSNIIVARMRNIIQFLMVGVGIMVTISVVVAGIQYTLSRGNPNKSVQAVQRLTYAGIALFLYVFGSVILNWLIPGGIALF